MDAGAAAAASATACLVAKVSVSEAAHVSWAARSGTGGTTSGSTSTLPAGVHSRMPPSLMGVALHRALQSCRWVEHFHHNMPQRDSPEPESTKDIGIIVTAPRLTRLTPDRRRDHHPVMWEESAP
eukprot:5817600-Prymnesium_polylepis.1